MATKRSWKNESRISQQSELYPMGKEVEQYPESTAELGQYPEVIRRGKDFWKEVG